MQLKKTYVADGILLFIAFIWGATFVVVQNALSFLEPNTFNALRFSIAAFILFAVRLFLSRKNQLKITKNLLISGIILGFWLFIGYTFQTIGLLYTTSAKAGFITGLNVVLVPVLSIFLLRTKLAVPQVIGVGLATAGLYLLTMTGSSGVNIGDFLVLICAFGFAMQIILTGKYTEKFPTIDLTLWQISTVAVLSWIAALLFEDWSLAFQPATFQQEVLFALVITSLFATAIAFFAQTHFQKFTTATHTALIFAMEPVFAALTDYLWNGVTMSTSGIFGSILIFTGMILAKIPVKNIFSTKFSIKSGKRL